MTISATDRRRVRGHLHNVAPAAFVQMIAIERETCALAVREDGREGVLFFVVGDLWDAQLGDLSGEEAAVKILGWDLADVETRVLTEPPPRSINAPLTFVLLESMRRRDEGAREKGPEALPATLPAVPALAALVRQHEGIRGACLIDYASGQSLEDHFVETPGLDPTGVIGMCHELARANHLLAGKAMPLSSLEEILLTFGEQVIVLRFLRTDLLLAIIAEASPNILPTIYGAVRTIAPLHAKGASPWQG